MYTAGVWREWIVPEDDVVGVAGACHCRKESDQGSILKNDRAGWKKKKKVRKAAQDGCASRQNSTSIMVV